MYIVYFHTGAKHCYGMWDPLARYGSTICNNQKQLKIFCEAVRTLPGVCVCVCVCVCGSTRRNCFEMGLFCDIPGNYNVSKINIWVRIIFVLVDGNLLRLYMRQP